MLRSKLAAATALLAVVSTTALMPVAAHADNWWQRQQSLQNNKNTMRNIAIGAAALGVYGLATHNTTAAVIGGVGAAIAGSQYENDRHQQSVDHNDWRYDRYYHRGWR
jgi:hypothetical protein